MRAEPLRPDAVGDNGLPQFDFPSLDQRGGPDVSWADTMDTLRPPRKREQKFWEWRRESAIRPDGWAKLGQ